MAEDRNKYIGYDPVKWVGRLIDVNDGSLFKDEEKKIISKHLNSLYRELETLPAWKQS